jgi:hypothetical protein
MFLDLHIFTGTKHTIVDEPVPEAALGLYFLIPQFALLFHEYGSANCDQAGR